MSDGISKKVVETALKNKIHVITPNKALIAKHGDYLAKLAEKNKVNLEFEASVGGGIPIIRTIKEGLATNKINKVFGILNGTCNYILSEMEHTKENFKTVKITPVYKKENAELLENYRPVSTLPIFRKNF